MPRLIDADKINAYLQKNSVNHTLTDIDAQPTVDAEPVRHGHWINHYDDLFPEDSSVECSVCHEYEGIMANDNYCPNCGAKMDAPTQKSVGNALEALDESTMGQVKPSDRERKEDAKIN